jgi:hypothetical protein
VRAQGVVVISQWFCTQTAFVPAGGTGAQSGHPVLGAHMAAFSAACPAMLTAVHCPCEVHSQHSSPLRNLHSVSALHFENSGTKRESNAWQWVPPHRAPM